MKKPKMPELPKPKKTIMLPKLGGVRVNRPGIYFGKKKQK